MRSTGCAYNKFEILRESEPQSSQHTLKGIFGIVDTFVGAYQLLIASRISADDRMWDSRRE